MPSKSSLIKIAFALAVICFYTYVFAIMDVVEIAADPSGEAAFSHEQGHPSTPNNPHDSRNPVATTIDIRNPPVPRLEDYEEAPAPQVLPDEFSDSHGGYETFLPPDYFESSYTAATDGTSAPATALTTNLTTVLTTAPATALTTAPTTAP
ncbi:MAG: hypothetical protein FWD35_01495, partial [Oscillospiraceae bacterium]|nr:hypothetical protein [Oscillospiraceae bacterium]